MATDSYLRRTAITRLATTPVQEARLEETFDEWRRGANIATDIGWEHTETGTQKLQSLAYDTIRKRTDLGSQHAILACFHAAQALSGIDERTRQNRSASKPTFTAPTLPYDTNTMTLFDDGTVSLTTAGDRIRCTLCLPESADGYQYQFLDSEDWSLTESTLTARDGSYFLHLGFRKPKPSSEADTAEHRTVLGVDLGIENLAVTSTAHFASGREFTHRNREFERVRSGLQKTGTESAHRTLIRRSAGERRYNRDYLHRVANEIVDEALEYECTHIAFEDLTHIRESMPAERKFHQWAHRQLVSYVQYKAAERGIEIVFVDPRDTSKRCHACGHRTDRNRPDRDTFTCESCGSTANADYNAAKNIGWRFVRHGPHDSGRTGDGQLALKSGTVTPKRGFVSYSS